MRRITITANRSGGHRSAPAFAVFVFALAMALGGAASAMVHQYGTVVSGLTGAADRAPDHGAVVVRAAGNIRAAVDRYRRLLGPDNGGGPGGQPQGRREINWTAFPTGSPSRTRCRATSSIHPRRLEPGARS